MALFYSDTSVRTGTPVDVWKMDGTKQYLTHYANLLMLNFFAKHGTRAERADAEKELIICDRKLAFWRRHPNYVHELALKGVEALKRDWKSPA